MKSVVKRAAEGQKEERRKKLLAIEWQSFGVTEASACLIDLDLISACLGGACLKADKEWVTVGQSDHSADIV